MENLIIYGIIAVVVIINIIRTYQKEAKKNSERMLTQQERPAKPTSVPTPFSRPQRVKEASLDTEYIQTPQNASSMKSAYNFAEEGISDIQRHINNQSTSAFKDDEHFMKDEDVSGETFDLKLETSDDFKRAFVHTLIFDRKY